jgi:hypothetical protein
MKKLLPYLGLFLVLAVPQSGYSATLIASLIQQSGDFNGFTTAPGIDTTGANFIAVATVESQFSGCTLIDNKTNTYTAQVIQPGPSESVLSIWRVTGVPAVGMGHTWTLGGGATCQAPSIAVQAWSGATASPVDQSNSANATAMTIQPGAITPTNPDNVVITALGHFVSGTQFIEAGFTISNQAAFSPGAAYGLAFAYKVQTTATLSNPVWTLTSSTSSEAAIIDFKTTATALAGPKSGSLTTLGVGK